jgi:hypothetical protein
MDVSVKVLSLSNPWPWTIFDLPPPDAKNIENRSWMPPIADIGTRIAFHAAKSWDEAAISFLFRMGITTMPARKDMYPTGVIIGVVTIDRVVTESRTLRPDQRRWFFETRDDGKQNYGWLLVDVRRLTTPIPYRGAQGLRNLPPDVTAAIESQLHD